MRTARDVVAKLNTLQSCGIVYHAGYDIQTVREVVVKEYKVNNIVFIVSNLADEELPEGVITYTYKDFIESLGNNITQKVIYFCNIDTINAKYYKEIQAFVKATNKKIVGDMKNPYKVVDKGNIIKEIFGGIQAYSMPFAEQLKQGKQNMMYFLDIMNKTQLVNLWIEKILEVPLSQAESKGREKFIASYKGLIKKVIQEDSLEVLSVLHNNKYVVTYTKDLNFGEVYGHIQGVLSEVSPLKRINMYLVKDASYKGVIKKYEEAEGSCIIIPYNLLHTFKLTADIVFIYRSAAEVINFHQIDKSIEFKGEGLNKSKVQICDMIKFESGLELNEVRAIDIVDMYHASFERGDFAGTSGYYKELIKLYTALSNYAEKKLHIQLNTNVSEDVIDTNKYTITTSAILEEENIEEDTSPIEEQQGVEVTKESVVKEEDTASIEEEQGIEVSEESVVKEENTPPIEEQGVEISEENVVKEEDATPTIVEDKVNNKDKVKAAKKGGISRTLIALKWWCFAVCLKQEMIKGVIDVSSFVYKEKKLYPPTLDIANDIKDATHYCYIETARYIENIENVWSHRLTFIYGIKDNEYDYAELESVIKGIFEETYRKDEEVTEENIENIIKTISTKMEEQGIVRISSQKPSTDIDDVIIDVLHKYQAEVGESDLDITTEKGGFMVKTHANDVEDILSQLEVMQKLTKDTDIQLCVELQESKADGTKEVKRYSIEELKALQTNNNRDEEVVIEDKTIELIEELPKRYTIFFHGVVEALNDCEKYKKLTMNICVNNIKATDDIESIRNNLIAFERYIDLSQKDNTASEKVLLYNQALQGLVYIFEKVVEGSVIVLTKALSDKLFSLHTYNVEMETDIIWVMLEAFLYILSNAKLNKEVNKEEILQHGNIAKYITTAVNKGLSATYVMCTFDLSYKDMQEILGVTEIEEDREKVLDIVVRHIGIAGGKKNYTLKAITTRWGIDTAEVRSELHRRNQSYKTLCQSYKRNHKDKK